MESGANIPAPAMADIRSGRKRAAQLTSTWNGIGPEKQKLVYDPQQPIWSLLLWHETILPLTLKRNEIYVFTALHTALAILKHLNITDPWGNSPINAIVAPVSLLAFFVVFYNSQVPQETRGHAGKAAPRLGGWGRGRGIAAQDRVVKRCGAEAARPPLSPPPRFLFPSLAPHSR
jgi:hypothetical protein